MSTSTVCRSCSCLRAQVSRRIAGPLISLPAPATPFVRHGFQHRQSRPLSSASPSPSTSSAPPKRPSPYRLIPISTFLSDFAPLHVKGWRLDTLPAAQARKSSSLETAAEGGGGMVEMQDRRLVRRYDFERGKEGWRELVGFMQKVGEVVEAEDHHPSIQISPGSDHISFFPPVPPSVGYVLSVATHTHTPLPPLKYPNKSKDETMRPGVTGKDMKLAMKLEELYEGMSRRT